MDAISIDNSGFILSFKRMLNIASIESPAPILSTGLLLKDGHEYLLNLLSNKIEPSIPFVITKYSNFFFF